VATTPHRKNEKAVSLKAADFVGIRGGPSGPYRRILKRAANHKGTRA